MLISLISLNAKAEINEYGLVSLIDRKSNFTKLQSANYFISMGMVRIDQSLVL